MQQKLILVGYRASGKTSFGKGLAVDCRAAFVDADEVLIERAGMAVGEIFASEGEAGFRDREAAILAELVADERALVVATGGGCVEREANRELLAHAGCPVIYLHAPVAVLQQRLRHDLGDRPVLSGSDPVAEVAAMVARRDPWYRAVASHVVDTHGPVESVRAQLRSIVEN